MIVRRPAAQHGRQRGPTAAKAAIAEARRLATVGRRAGGAPRRAPHHGDGRSDMIEAGLNAIERRQGVDKVAAAIMLQSWLDARAASAPVRGLDMTMLDEPDDDRRHPIGCSTSGTRSSRSPRSRPVRQQTRIVKWAVWIAFVARDRADPGRRLRRLVVPRQGPARGRAGPPRAFTVSARRHDHVGVRAARGRGLRRRRRGVPVVRRPAGRARSHIRVSTSSPERPHGQRAVAPAHATRSRRTNA